MRVHESLFLFHLQHLIKTATIIGILFFVYYNSRHRGVINRVINLTIYQLVASRLGLNIVYD